MTGFYFWKIKIFHRQVNPFADYERYLLGLCDANDKQPLFVLLSPSGASPAGWSGLKYERFIDVVRKQLERNKVKSLSGWRVLAKEFMLHLHNITVEYGMNSEAFDFVFFNLCEIDKLRKLHERAVTHKSAI